MDGSAEIVDFQVYRDAADDITPAVLTTMLRRIRLLRRMLDRLELRVGTEGARSISGALDVADVGTDEMLGLAGFWFGWAFDDPPPPDWRQYRTEAWRDWCRRAAAP